MNEIRYVREIKESLEALAKASDSLPELPSKIIQKRAPFIDTVRKVMDVLMYAPFTRLDDYTFFPEFENNRIVLEKIIHSGNPDQLQKKAELSAMDLFSSILSLDYEGIKKNRNHYAIEKARELKIKHNLPNSVTTITQTSEKNYEFYQPSILPQRHGLWVHYAIDFEKPIKNIDPILLDDSQFKDITQTISQVHKRYGLPKITQIERFILGPAFEAVVSDSDGNYNKNLVINATYDTYTQNNKRSFFKLKKSFDHDSIIFHVRPFGLDESLQNTADKKNYIIER